MKIKLYLLAVDGEDTGTTVDWFYSEKERYEALIEIVGQDLAEGLKLLASGDHDALDDWVYNNTSYAFTYQTDDITVDTDKAETVT